MNTSNMLRRFESDVNTISVTVGPELFRFTSEREWVNKAQSWFINSGYKGDYVLCVDSAGRVCTIGAHFMRATNENTYPIICYVKTV